MLRIVMIAAWAVLLVLLLYIWADVREILGNVKDMKRDTLRASLSSRASESFPNFEKEAKEKQEKKQQEEQVTETAEEKRLNPQEEQVLHDVLTEFLG